MDIDTQYNKRQQIIEATRKKFGYDKVLNICTFKTEGSKSAIITAARSLDLSPDISHYLSSMIPVVRGVTTSLKVMVYGDEENGIKPNAEFINECSKYGDLLSIAMKIEGLVCGRSVHASGVIIFDDAYTEHNAMMRAPSGQPITQWDMDNSSYCGGLKYDYLTITNLDAMRSCLDLLLDYKKIEWQGSLRATYDKYFHPDILDYDSKEMWRMAKDGEIVNLFQFMTQVGAQAIKKIAPTNLTELGVANAVMRLQTPNSDEQPLDTYVKYKNDISKWYDKMHEYELSHSEIELMEKYLGSVCGMATMQEEVMMLSMDKNISNFDMIEASNLRKGIAKKKASVQEKAKKSFYEGGLKNNTSKNLLDYVWNECVTPQLSYSFSLPHILGYSTIAIQEMNMAYLYPIIYWNTANLIVDSGSLETDKETKAKSTNYGKIASAISNMKNRGTEVSFPLITEADLGFKPDEQNNRIIFGLAGINTINHDTANLIISNRPYTSFTDFCERMIDTKLIKNSQMIKLIKAGCFSEFEPDREKVMKTYLQKYQFSKTEKLTMQQFNMMDSLNVIPSEYEKLVSIVKYKKYVLDDEGFFKNYIDPESKRALPKCGYNDRWYKLDKNSQTFFEENFSEDSVVGLDEEFYLISEKKFKKEVDKLIEPLKTWMTSEEALEAYNDKVFEELWNKHASGTVPAWEMDSLSFYHTEHELANMQTDKYYVQSFNDLPEQPVAYDFYTRYINNEKKAIPKYNITRLAGTVLDADKNKHIITLLCHDNTVVTCKFNKGQYVHYSKTISEVADGKKHTIEQPWTKRGTKIIVCGYRQEDQFRVYKYSDSIFQHTVARIDNILPDGMLDLTVERVRV